MIKLKYNYAVESERIPGSSQVECRELNLTTGERQYISIRKYNQHQDNRKRLGCKDLIRYAHLDLAYAREMSE